MTSRRPSPSFVALLVVMLVVVAGTSYAAGKASGDSLIKKNSLSGNRLKSDTVKARQVQESSLGTVPRSSVADRATRADVADVADRADLADSVAPVSRLPLSLGTGWEAGPSVGTAPTYGLDAQGWVRLEGEVSRTSGSGTVIGTLPAGFRPGALVFFAVFANTGTLGTIRVEDNGELILKSGDAAFIALDGITFRAAQSG